MINGDQNNALLTVGNAAWQNPAWHEYALYCFDREKGLRKEAFEHLARFLATAKDWTFTAKVDFVKFLCPFLEDVPEANYAPFPQPLKETFIKPVLLAWCGTEQKDSTPFRWYGRYFDSEEHLLKALERMPSDDAAREILIKRWIYELYFSVHHLPHGYAGEPAEDMKLCEKTVVYIEQLASAERRKYWMKELEEDEELVRNYIQWENSGHADFKLWGMENNKKVGYGRDID